MEIGSDFVEELASTKSKNLIILAGITQVEVAATIARKIKGGSVVDSDAALALAAFTHDLNNRYLMIDIEKDVLSAAMKIATKHALRGYDSVQLAAALAANRNLTENGDDALTFVSADADLNATAIAEGLSVKNPNDHDTGEKL
jgi:predicted nucleic acid-binding protein